MQIETDRLLLRPIGLDALDDLAALHANVLLGDPVVVYSLQRPTVAKDPRSQLSR